MALGTLLWQDHLLLAPSTIPGDPPGWRCPGGSIELGERAEDAVTRVFIEEMGRRVEVLEALPVVEDIRSHGGETGHELSFPFVVQWRDGYEPFDLAPIECFESTGERFQARWVPLADLHSGGLTIHPAGLTAALFDWLNRRATPAEEVPPRRRTPIRRPLADGETRRGAQRVVALGHLLWRDHLLLHPVVEAGTPIAWRSLGGGVGFGERAADAVHREFVEETARAVEVVESKGAAENIFERDDAIGHEAVFEYLVRWAPGHEPESLDDLECVESGGGRFAARWMPLEEVLSGRNVIYPDGFVDRLRGWLSEGADA
ncbi:MAG: NUDIX domain-containing protein [Chloroflexi bacterium]|nr:NUDIX domain-containing protein [Chloroflexota bacterium]